MAGWQTPETISRNLSGDMHPDTDEGRKEVYIQRSDGVVVVAQAWRFEQMIKQAGLDGVLPPKALEEQDALPLVAEQDRKNKEVVDKGNWRGVIEEAKVKAEKSNGNNEKLVELEKRITAQDAKLDAILLALAK